MLRVIQSNDLEPGGPPVRGGRITLACAPPREGQHAIAALEVGKARGSAVGYVTESAGGWLRVTGWFPRRQLRQLREILARGGQLHLFFDLRDAGARVGYLRRIGLSGPQGVLATASAAPAPARVAAGGRPRAAGARFAMPL
jgi:hypothetical protein